MFEWILFKLVNVEGVAATFANSNLYLESIIPSLELNSSMAHLWLEVHKFMLFWQSLDPFASTCQKLVGKQALT